MKISLFIILFIVLATLAAYIRFFLSSVTHSYTANLTVNFIGCLLIGFVFFLKQNNMISNSLWLLLAVAFLGALTTFSSYILDIFKLFSEQNYWQLVKYVSATHILCILAYYFGFTVGEKVFN